RSAGGPAGPTDLAPRQGAAGRQRRPSRGGRRQRGRRDARMKLFFLAVKNLRRNLLRTALTSVATMVLVFVITLIWSILWFLNAVTAEKSKDFKAIVSERWQIPSQMPFTYARDLS